MQWAAPFSLLNLDFRLAGGSHCRIFGDRDESVQRGIQLLDVREAISGQLHRRKLSFAQKAAKFHDGSHSVLLVRDINLKLGV